MYYVTKGMLLKIAALIVTAGSVLLLASQFRQPTGAQAMRDVPPDSQSYRLRLPEVGSRLSLPSKDLWARPIIAATNHVVVAMPACQSCVLRHVDWPKLAKLSSAPIVLVFPEAPSKELSVVRQSRFRVLIEPKEAIFLDEMHTFGPNLVVLDREGRITSTKRSL